MEIIWLGHASFKIKTQDKIIYIDPYFGDYEDKADIILISHSHHDHLNMEKVNLISTDNTIIISSKEVASTIHGAKPLLPGQSEIVGEIAVEAVEAYNLNKEFHPKGFGVGFIITLEGKRVYFSGDTDKIPEMKSYDVDVALVPVGGIYTMNSDEAVEAIKLIKPKFAIPMHFASGVVGTIDDAELFKEKVELETDTKVTILKHGESFKL
ncbi:MAG: MBL fold metallo-hydrolase [Candidatus Woesearchaeota archaeon]|jgi:L-ascorbate metabolism protein UlaG (beta-lactamase superfamily)|nr:MBL fold metallo-hydrolase [Candidatus Woesearchaeota archaeon]